MAATLTGAVGQMITSDHSAEPADVSRLSADGGGLTNAAVAGLSLPQVPLVDASGEEIDTSELTGKPLVINVWHSLCPPCAKELPDFAEVHSEVADQVRFVGINPIDSAERMQRFAADRGVTYELLRDPHAVFIDAVGVVAFPVTLFVAADGTIVDQAGILDAAELRQHTRALVATGSG